MSDKISYILEVLDNYSVNTRKFRKEIGSVESSIKSLNTNLAKTTLSLGKIGAFSELGKLSAQLNKVAASINKVNQADIKSISLSKRKLMPGYGVRGTYWNEDEQRYSSRKIAPQTHKRTFAGAYTPIKFDPYEGKYVGRPKPDPSAMGYGVAGLMGRGLGAENIAAGLGFAGAAYTVGRSVKYVHDTTVQMDSLRASLSALIPKVKGLEGATPEGEIKYLRGVSNKYGLSFSDIAPSYIKMLGTGGKVDASLAKGLVENIGGYAGLMGLSSPATQDTMRAFQDMLSKQVLNAQEINLQMQQLPGGKAMMHKAFYRIAQREGRKDITMENASAEFTKSMATGKLSAALMLREFVKVIEEEFGKKMIEKAYKLGNEERRLASATQELSTALGDLAYPAMIGAVRGMTEVVSGVNTFVGDAKIVGGYLSNLLSDKAKQITPNNPEVRSWLGRTAEVAGGTAVDVLKMAYGSPLYALKYGGGMMAAQVAGTLGDQEMKQEIQSKLKKDFVENNFEHLQSLYNNEWKTIVDALNANSQAIMMQNKQKVEVKITTENMPDFFSVQTSQPNMSMWRPSTVIAGQR